MPSERAPTCDRSLSGRLEAISTIPLQITLYPIHAKTRALKTVMLAGIDHELRRHPDSPQRLIHLLRADRRNVVVLGAHEEQRWRRDAVRMQER